MNAPETRSTESVDDLTDSYVCYPDTSQLLADDTFKST